MAMPCPTSRATHYTPAAPKPHTHLATSFTINYGATRTLNAILAPLLLALVAPCHAIMLPSIPCDPLSNTPLMETGNMPLANTHNASLFYWLVRHPKPSPSHSGFTVRPFYNHIHW